jgi:GNAT superfamily N-acetyltransferase
MEITKMLEPDFNEFWPTFKLIVEARNTYAFEPTISFEEAKALWWESPMECYVAKENGLVLGSYYLKKNGAGPSSHISNCGYMVTPSARGKGVASQLCLHSLERAKENGFKAMQFNSVVSTNKAAIDLWKRHGFSIVGTIPQAYDHEEFGLVDTYLMYRFL